MESSGSLSYTLAELTELLETIYTIQKDGKELTEEEHFQEVLKFKKFTRQIGVPGGTDLIYYPGLAGLPDGLIPKELAEYILDHATK